MHASRLAAVFVGAALAIGGPKMCLASDDQVAELLGTIKRLEARIASLERRQSINQTALASAQPSKKAKDSPHTAYARAIPEPVYRTPSTAAISSPVISWNNFYAGVALGVGSMPLSLNSASIREDSTITFAASPDNSIGLLSDFFIGWNRQLGSSYVLGVQFEGTLTSIRNQHETVQTGRYPTEYYIYFDKSPTELDWMASALIRIGWLPSQDNLIYLAGGWSYAALSNRWLDDTFSLNGPTAAIGWEKRFGSNWSFRTEYRYAHFLSQQFDTSFSVRSTYGNYDYVYNSSARADLHIVKAGFAYLTD